MSASTHLPERIGNRLLAALPWADYERLRAQLQPVRFSLAEVIHGANQRLEYIYFPATAVISLLYTMKSGATAEMGLVGNEGAVGIAAFLGGQSMPNRAVVQIAGNAHRLSADVLQEECAHGPELRRLLLRYTQALITQAFQTAVCNSLHLDQDRLARWLLECHDPGCRETNCR